MAIISFISLKLYLIDFIDFFLLFQRQDGKKTVLILDYENVNCDLYPI